MRIQYVKWFFFIFCYKYWICLSADITAVSGQIVEDQQSLLRLRNNLKFKSENSQKLVSWNPSIGCCEWKGVTCDEEGHVIGLDLSGESICGGLDNSSSLFSLPNLQRLNLATNNFNSVIPSGFNKLKNLTYLNMSNAGFVGQIPIEIAHLTRLVTLDISSNSLYNQALKFENLDLRKLLQNLNMIRQLYLDGISVTAEGPEWCDALLLLSSLEELSMSNCNLSGPLDPSLARLKNLSIIRLDQNNLSSTVPKVFANFPNLTTLHLSSCGLTGIFPEKIFQIATLLVIDISSNDNLYGSLPEFPLYGSLQTLIISNTGFSGTLPVSISNLRQLSSLDLSNCSFNGTLPRSMSRLGKLTFLHLSFNNFTGPIPSLNMPKKLTHLDLSHNGLKGPFTFPASCALRTLDLSENPLAGPIPKSLANCRSLEVLDLGNSQLNDEFPCFLKSLSTLRVMVLRGNKLHGPIVCAHANGTWHMLQVVDLASNNFSGLLPGELFKTWDAMLLDETYGDIYYQDSILTSIGSQIDFSSNNFQGPIPEELMKFTRLSFLNLSHNALIGLIPSSIGNLKMLESLDLSSNYFDGEIPTQLINLTFLTNLNLSYNLLVGKIPQRGQFLTFGSDSYLGNEELCGIPLTKSCYYGVSMSPHEEGHAIDWKIICVELGLIFGIGLVIGPLMIWKQWRQCYWKRVDSILCYIFPQLNLEYERRGGHTYQVLRWRY